MAFMKPLVLLSLSLSLVLSYGKRQSWDISDQALLEELHSLDKPQAVHELDHGVEEKVDIERMAEILCGEGKPKSRGNDGEGKRVANGANVRIGPMPLPGWLDSVVGEARKIVWSVGPRMRT